MRIRLALVAVGVAILGGIVGGAARAALPAGGLNQMLPAPSGGTRLPAAGVFSTTALLPDGTIVPVTITSSSTQALPAQVATLGGANIDAAAALTCWTVANEVDYGPSWAIIMTYRQTVGWCGNGSKISGTPGQQIAAKVTTTGQVTFWVFDSVIDKEMTQYYAGWAYQAYTEGHFHQCPIVQFACFDDKYPQLWMNVYANGTYQNYWSG